MRIGLFLTIEGCDGSGKTTACTSVIERLTQEGYDVMYSREPGGSDIAEQIRKVILDVKNTAMDVRTEALLYAASRRQHLIEKIIPAINQGKIVICDRFIDSSLAYQGYGREIGIEDVLKINQFSIEGYFPDLTIYYDIDPQSGLNRIASRKNLDRLDVESLNFHNRVHQGYQIVCQMFPDRIKVIDASKSKQEVSEQTYQLIKEKINSYESR